MTVIAWPPRPHDPCGPAAFAYNVYTDLEHRRRGLGRLVMETMHAFCRQAGIGTVFLNASRLGLPMYEAMGYQTTDSPIMFLALTRYRLKLTSKDVQLLK
jgi:GNAT superfamily N-acetyltransferase